MSWKKRWMALVLASSALAAQADLIDWNDLDFVFGSGANRSAVVVDWNDGVGLGYLTWGFYWDAPPGAGFVADLLQALETSDSRFDVSYTDFGPSLGLFVDAIGFDAEPNGSYLDAGDHLRDRAGSFAETFVFWQGAATDAAWMLASAGVSSTALVSEEVYGFAWNNSGGFPGDPPPVIPEPGTLAFVSLGATLLAALRRRIGS